MQINLTKHRFEVHILFRFGFSLISAVIERDMKLGDLSDSAPNSFSLSRFFKFPYWLMCRCSSETAIGRESKVSFRGDGKCKGSGKETLGKPFLR